MNNWKQSNIGDVVEIKYGKDHKILNDGKYPLYGSGGIMRYVESFIYDKPSVLIPRKGSIENLFFTDKPFWSVDTLFWTKIDANKIDPRFLFYLLSCIKLSRFDEGSAIPSLTVKTLNEIVISYPESLTEQIQIRKVLEKIDMKIELLLQQNQTLEEMAQTLFKEWFVNFRFPGAGKMVDSELGMIPEGWKVGKLEELIEIKYGKDHKHLEEGTIPVYGSGGIMRYANKPLYSDQSILIPRKGTLSNLFYIKTPFWTVDTMFYSKIRKKEFGKFCFLLLKTFNLASMDVGSAVPSLTTHLLNGIKIIIPDNKIMKTFDDVVSTIFKKKEFNETQIQTLTQFRDRLLPKLMSGELRVKTFNFKK